MNILTFDIEEWFHTQFDPVKNTESEWNNYESRLDKNMDLIFHALEEKNQKATFFCLGWIARKYPHIIKKIDALGHEIGCHSDLHNLAYLQDRKTYKEDFENAIKLLENTIGKKIISYRAPAFSIREDNKWAFEIIIENGIEIDCSIFPTKREYGGFHNFSISEPCIIKYNGHELKEFPMNSYSFLGKEIIFSGGGYFRFFPLWLLKNMFSQSKYVMTYFHPRDFDSTQPMIKELPLHRKFKSYYGLKKSYKKFKSLIDTFDFIDVGTAVERIDWKKVSKIDIS